MTQSINEKIFPNFWQALILTSCFLVLWLIIHGGYWTLIKSFDNSYTLFVMYNYLFSFVFALFVLWLAKKTRINILSELLAPNIVTLGRIVAITVLAKTIMLPFDRPQWFFQALLEGQLRILLVHIRPLNLSSILIMPVLEEIFFRGLILKQFLKQYSPISAIVLSSLLFSFGHLNSEAIVYLLGTGVLYGFLYYKTKSVLIPIISHIISNVITNLTIYGFESTNPVFFLLYVGSFLIFVPLLKKPLVKVEINYLMEYSKKTIEKLNIFKHTAGNTIHKLLINK